MCYSKEVSLIAGLGISSISSWFYLKVYAQTTVAKWTKRIMAPLKKKQFSKVATEVAVSPHPSNIRGFLAWYILGFAAIGGHQLGEFVSIATGSEFVYKIGLISSILCTYFMLRAFEAISAKRLGSTLVLAAIALLSVDIFMTPMVFENAHFWVRGFSHKIWAVVWLVLWLYLLAGIALLGLRSKEKGHRFFYWVYGLGGINVSFLLSWIYATLAHRYSTSCTVLRCSYSFLQDFTYTYDFPSLWCTFTIIQAPFLYLVMRYVLTRYNNKESFGGWKPRVLDLLGMALAAGGLMVFWYYFTPMLLGVSWKMMAK